MRRFNTGCGLAVALCLMLGTGRAQAQIQLDIGSSGIPTPGPWAEVGLAQAGNNVTVTVTAEGPGTPEITEFGFNAPGNTGFTLPDSWTQPGSQPMDGFGTFAQSMGGSGLTSFTFTVDNVTTSSFDGNGSGYQFAVAWRNQAIGNPYYAANSAVPEPGPLLGAGVVTLMGLGYTWRRRRQATV